jgi:hypothetical protein
MRLLDGKGIAEADFRKVKGGDVGLEWLNSDEHAMREPIIFEGAEGLGMKMPRSTLSVMDIAEKIGMDTPVEVIGTLLRIFRGITSQVSSQTLRLRPTLQGGLWASGLSITTQNPLSAIKFAMSSLLRYLGPTSPRTFFPLASFGSWTGSKGSGRAKAEARGNIRKYNCIA